MQRFSTETKAKETTLQKRLIEKRNLFGLGLTSLIAACSSAADGGDDTNKIPDDDDNNKIPDDDDNTMHDNGIATYTPTIDLPDEVVEAAELSAGSGFTTIKGGTSSGFTVSITGGALATLTLSDGVSNADNKSYIYKLTATATQHDLVVSSPTIDGSKGGIFIFWNLADIQDETIGGTSTTTTNERLEIKGAAANDTVGSFAPEFLQIGGTKDSYDMVFVGKGVDRVSGSSTNEGAIYVLWDVADYVEATKTIDLASIADATAGSLAIHGKIAADSIGTYAPQLLELGSANDAYDMVIRSHTINKTAAGEGAEDIKDEGAVYILWDVTGYHDTEVLNETVILDNSLIDTSGVYTNGATYGLMAIYGAKSGDNIGTHAPEFLQIGGKADNYDMIVRSRSVDRLDSSGGTVMNSGAIYILWDIADYTGQNKTIDLESLDADITDSNSVAISTAATAGSLTIYGAQSNNLFGINAPEFLQIAGTDNNYDMVVGSHAVSKLDGSAINAGAIYILWDVADYAGQNKTIDLGNLADAVGTSANVGATAGSLAIYGAKASDALGLDAFKFSQIAGKDDNQDMVIGARWADKGSVNGTGAIYILWDVADYYSAGTDKNKTIDLGNLADASSGLLTIYGRAASTSLGTVDKNILYNADGALTNIDGDTDNGGTKDIALTDDRYTYIFFGDKITTTTGTGVDEKVDSKTIDLGAIETLLGNSAGFFNYNFVDNGLGTATTPASTADRVGYRFADKSHADLDAVQTAYNAANPLSDTDSDLGVWDIA